MGKTHHGTLQTLTFLLVLLFATGTADISSLNAQGIGTHAHITSFTMPQYNEKDNRLQFIVYGKTADNKGALILLDGMVIDFMRNNLMDVKTVKILLEATPYPLETPKKEVEEYWASKEHSQGLVFSENAVLDKTAQILRSNKRVKFRSPYLDVDGIGFDAYQNRKFLHIRSQVRLFLRPEARNQAMSGNGDSNRRYRSAEEILNEDNNIQQSNTTTKE